RLEANWGMTGLLLGRRGALADVRVRRALALTAPRAAIADALALAVLQPQSRLVPGLPPLPPLPQPMALAEARKLLQQAGKGGPQRLRLQVLLPEGAAAGRIADALATAWAPLGVDVVPVSKREAQRRRLLARSEPLADVDMALVEWATPLPDAALFLARLRCGHRLACTQAADALLAQANATSDLAKRQSLLAEAESRWREDAQLVPLANPIGWALVKTDVDGFQANSAGVHPLWPLRRRG
ncbi:MAG: ABC transporter substrate-binding protein, partial [Sphingomonadales bacterium]